MRKCLLVDDDHSMLELLSHAMEEFGFDTVTATDGDEGLTAFREHHPELVVSDIHMPNRNGLMLLSDIKSMEPDVPVILITGYLHYKAAMNLSATRPDMYMEKPFTLDALRNAIDQLLPLIDHVWERHQEPTSKVK